EKHAPRILVETRFPSGVKGPTLQDLIEGKDPRIARLRSGDQRFAKMLDLVEKGQSQKVMGADAVDFLRAAVPIIAPNARFVMAKRKKGQGFDWIAARDERAERVIDKKARPPDAPTLRRKSN